MSPEYAGLVVKPDAIRDSLDPLLLEEVRRTTGCLVAYRKMFRFYPKDAEILYPEWIGRPAFPYMVRNLTAGPSMVFVLKGPCGLRTVLRAVKGKMNLGGLRLKYRTRSIEEWRALGLSEDQVQLRAAENRIHTTDSLEELKMLCGITLTRLEIEDMHQRHPEAGSILSQNKDLVPSAPLVF